MPLCTEGWLEEIPYLDPLVLKEGYYTVLSRLRVSNVVSEEERVLMSDLFDPLTYMKLNSTV